MPDNETPVLPGLSKWPALVVKGKSVTMDQAAEIIIRTNGTLDFRFRSNDKPFEKSLNEAVGLPEDPYKEGFDWQKIQEVDDRYGLLAINYLQNSRILSPYIGGPHGWIDWSGNIRTMPSYNIGKWPNCEKVLEEWRLIAATWPYLDLQCQLMDGEDCQTGIRPVIEYHVKDGTVTYTTEVGEPLHFEKVDIVGSAMNIFNSGRERGCTIEMYKKALEITKKALVLETEQ